MFYARSKQHLLFAIKRVDGRLSGRRRAAGITGGNVILEVGRKATTMFFGARCALYIETTTIQDFTSEALRHNPEGETPRSVRGFLTLQD